jgi:hypothetical protein
MELFMSGSAQADFMRRGGPMAAILESKYESGELQRETPFHEYPKYIRISKGVQKFDRSTLILRGKDEVEKTWVEEREVFDEYTVASEAEEEAVLSGGRTAAQVEEDRQAMIALCRQRGIQCDPTWGIVRLQRELGAAPSNETIDAMRTKIADLEEKAALRERIAALEAQIAGRAMAAPAESTPSQERPGRLHLDTGTTTPRAATHEDEAEDIRAQLGALGVAVDLRWGLSRLQRELEAATAPARR